MKKRRLHTMSPVCTALALAAGTLLAGGVTLALQQGSLLATLSAFWAEPILFVLNLWPVAALALLFYFLLGNAWYGAGLTTLIWGLLSYINLVKVDARGDPFVPGDILLLTEGMEAVGSYQLNMHWGKLALLLGLSLALILLGTGVKSARPRLVIRLVAALTVVAAFGTTMAFLYPDSELYDRMEGPNRANVPAVYEAFGFPYCFLHNFNLYPVDKPPGYNAQEAASYEDTYREAEAAPETAPNILMVMCEAFTDLPNQAAFTYTGENNPIAAYNRLAEQTLSGHLVVSNTGAGTANTEFDVLTGMMTNRIGTGTTSAFRVVHRNIDSIPRMLTQAGYRTFFLHPGQNWFYNRESVYSYLGITDQVFQDAFSRSDLVGDWISDAGFLRVLKESLEARQGDTPLFTYAVTIQNHQSYGAGKYGYVPDPPQTDIALSDAARTYLSVYFKGLQDSAAMLEELTEYLDSLDAPYLLVFFGDHQPNLGGHYLAYRELDPNYGSTDTVEETLQPYTVPYLIWGNAAYRQDHDLLAQAQAWNLPETISSHYLGALTCQLAGYQGHDGYFDFLNALREQLPVSSVYGYQLSDGSYTDTLPDDLQALEDIRWKWQYYRLMEQPLS
ncbi:MAG TPA: LTA synthase family protein [Candidatus Faecousia gallistercoris]|nr:LTA synthase family protein [Candidatus Faecousia gallistercoris]